MGESRECDLHEAVLRWEEPGCESLLEFVRSPLGDECRRCSVCRWARTYIQRCLDERTGRPLPPGGDAAAARRELMDAIREVRVHVHSLA